MLMSCRIPGCSSNRPNLCTLGVMRPKIIFQATWCHNCLYSNNLPRHTHATKRPFDAAKPIRQRSHIPSRSFETILIWRLNGRRGLQIRLWKKEGNGIDPSETHCTTADHADSADGWHQLRRKWMRRWFFGRHPTPTPTPTPTPNPSPTISALSPTNIKVGGNPFVLTVTGTNFVSASVVQWNGSNRPTTFVTSTQLSALIPASDIATGGKTTITVSTPAPGGGTSGSLSFNVRFLPRFAYVPDFGLSRISILSVNPETGQLLYSGYVPADSAGPVQ